MTDSLGDDVTYQSVGGPVVIKGMFGEFINQFLTKINMKISFPSLFCNCPRNIEDTLNGLTTFLGKILMTLDQLKQTLDDTKAQLVKAAGEITAKIDALEAQLATVVTTPEVDAALAELKAVAQQLDDINPDVVE